MLLGPASFSAMQPRTIEMLRWRFGLERPLSEVAEFKSKIWVSFITVSWKKGIIIRLRLQTDWLSIKVSESLRQPTKKVSHQQTLLDEKVEG